MQKGMKRISLNIVHTEGHFSSQNLKGPLGGIEKTGGGPFCIPALLIHCHEQMLLFFEDGMETGKKFAYARCWKAFQLFCFT